LHLLNDPWLTIRKADGSRIRIRPCDLIDIEVEDVDAPRADLVVAARTFLIGLVTTAGLAETESDWQRLYDNPPTADAIMAGLQHYASAFELFGEGHRFCQHQAVVEDDDRQRIASILIDGPSDESDVRNHDVMMDIVGFSPPRLRLHSMHFSNSPLVVDVAIANQCEAGRQSRRLCPAAKRYGKTFG
jgi:CRISPR system Cascade subunit CasA